MNLRYNFVKRSVSQDVNMYGIPPATLDLMDFDQVFDFVAGSITIPPPVQAYYNVVGEWSDGYPLKKLERNIRSYKKGLENQLRAPVPVDRQGIITPGKKRAE